jgi:hypothetical protein
MDENLTEVSSEAQDPRVRQARKIALYGIVLSALFAVLSIGSLLINSNSENTTLSSSSSSQDSLGDSSWVPVGYTVWGNDSNIAWRFADKDSYKCDDYSCIALDFISQNGCPNGLYADLNWLDSNENVVSYDSASLPSLYEMQTAKLVFNDRDELGELGQIASIECL